MSHQQKSKLLVGKVLCSDTHIWAIFKKCSLYKGTVQKQEYKEPDDFLPKYPSSTFKNIKSK